MLFVYGTLQDPDILAAVLGRRLDPSAFKTARAPDFGVLYYPHRVYPALVVAPGRFAIGMIVDGLDDLDMAVLDAFEGDEYRRSAIGVVIEGRAVNAEAYLPVIDIDTDGPAWSLQDWTTRHKSAVVGTETATATGLRERLSAQPGRPMPHVRVSLGAK